MVNEAWEVPKPAIEKRSVGNPERMILPLGLQAEISEKHDSQKGHDFTTETVAFQVDLKGRRYSIEAGTSNGGRKKPDEDFVCIKTYNLPGSDLTSLLWVGVKDGMGGMGSGDQASAHAARAADEYLTRLSQSQDLWNQLKDKIPAEQARVNLAHKQKGLSEPVEEVTEEVTIELMLMKEVMEIQNRAVFEFNQRQAATSGATTVDVFIFPDTDFLVEGHAGDSRYYHQKSGQRPRRSTIDHNMAESLRAAGEEVAPGQSSQVYRSLGGGDLRLFTRLARPMDIGDNAILNCDGFADSLGDKSGGQLNRSGEPLHPNEWQMSDSMAKILNAPPSEDHAQWVMQQAQTAATDNLSFVRVLRTK